MEKVRIVYSQFGIILFGLWSGTGVVEGQLPIGEHQIQQRWSAQFLLKWTNNGLSITALVQVRNSQLESRIPSYVKCQPYGTY